MSNAVNNNGITITQSALLEEPKSSTKAQYVLEHQQLAKRCIIPCLNFDDQERLAATSQKMRANVKDVQREVIVKEFPPFIKQLVPGGEAAFNQLPIQIFCTRKPAAGLQGEKRVMLEVRDLVKVNGRTPDVVIGMEVNEADTFENKKILKEEFKRKENEKGIRLSQDHEFRERTKEESQQPFRPVMAIPVRLFREARSSLCCMSSLTVDTRVHVLYGDVFFHERLPTWGASGPILTTDAKGYKHENATRFTETDKDCFKDAQQILSGEVLPHRIATTNCNAHCDCGPSGCGVTTPCAPLEALLFDTAVKMEKLSGSH